MTEVDFNIPNWPPEPEPIFEVRAKRCDECLFTSRRLVDEKEKAKILSDCIERQTYFVCHQSEQCCAGFYEAMADVSRQVRMAKFRGLVRHVRPGP